MTTRRNLIKGTAGVGLAALTVKSSAAEETRGDQKLESVDMDETRYIATPLAGGLMRLRTGFDWQTVARHLGIDQDIDGTWCVWCDCVGPGDDDDRGAEGSIKVYDPVIADFLERLHLLLTDPVAFDHQTIGRREAA